MLGHVAGMPVEEWVMPMIVSASAVLVGIRGKVHVVKERSPQ